MTWFAKRLHDDRRRLWRRFAHHIAQQRGAVCIANICEIREICVQNERTVLRVEQGVVLFLTQMAQIYHAGKEMKGWYLVGTYPVYVRHNDVVPVYVRHIANIPMSVCHIVGMPLLPPFRQYSVYVCVPVDTVVGHAGYADIHGVCPYGVGVYIVNVVDNVCPLSSYVCREYHRSLL